MQKQLQNLSLNDLGLISILPRYQSLRALARDRRMTVSSISVKLSFFEQELGVTIITRSARGYSLTQNGARLAKVAGEILAQCENLLSVSKKPTEKAQTWLTFGSRGFINSLLAPPIIQSLYEAKSSINFRFIDFSPQELVVAAFRSSLDAAVTLETCFLGERWQSEQLGETRRVLLARKGHPLENAKDLRSLADFRVLRTAYWDGNSVVSSGDVLPDLAKQTGCELQTAATAISVLLNSDCVAYLPRLAAAHALKTNQVKEIFPRQAEGHAMPVFFHINKDSISQKLYQTLLAILSRTIKESG
ncbi:MAG: hypothetical protein RL189_2860 [Pseudomonadota bacterium]|jgi:DNA-binding transcriptional LysR family regulator